MAGVVFETFVNEAFQTGNVKKSFLVQGKCHRETFDGGLYFVERAPQKFSARPQPAWQNGQKPVGWPKIYADDVVETLLGEQIFGLVEVGLHDLKFNTVIGGPVLEVIKCHIRDVNGCNTMPQRGKVKGMTSPSAGQIEGLAGNKAVVVFQKEKVGIAKARFGGMFFVPADAVGFHAGKSKKSLPSATGNSDSYRWITNLTALAQPEVSLNRNTYTPGLRKLTFNTLELIK